jgi:hypothetical protein
VFHLCQLLLADSSVPAGIDRTLISYPLFLCRTFQRARLFLLPTLRLRLDLAIHFSVKETKVFIVKYAFSYSDYMVS